MSNGCGYYWELREDFGARNKLSPNHQLCLVKGYQKKKKQLKTLLIIFKEEGMSSYLGIQESLGGSKSFFFFLIMFGKR